MTYRRELPVPRKGIKGAKLDLRAEYCSAGYDFVPTDGVTDTERASFVKPSKGVDWRLA